MQLEIYKMTTIKVKENEPFDVALRRFKRLVEKTGLMNDLRAKEFYEKQLKKRNAAPDRAEASGARAA